MDHLIFHLFSSRQQGFGLVVAAAQFQNDTAIPGIDAGDDAGQDLMFFGGKFIGDHAALRLPDALDDHLLCCLGGDAAEFAGVDLNAHFVAFHRQRRILGRFFRRNFRGRVLHIGGDGLHRVHGDGARIRVDLYKDIVQRGALGILFINGFVSGGQSLGNAVQHVIFFNAFFFFQVRQGLHQVHDIHEWSLLLSIDGCKIVIFPAAGNLSQLVPLAVHRQAAIIKTFQQPHLVLRAVVAAV